MKNNINNKDQRNDAIEHEPNFDKKFNLSNGTKDPPPLVTVSLRGGKKQRETIIYNSTLLWDSLSTNSTIKRKNTHPYKHKMCSNNVEYSTAAETYCTTHDAKVPFCMLEFSSSNIIPHSFHMYNNEGESGIGYDMIISRNLIE